MAVAYVQSNSVYNSGPVTLTGASAGNTLVVYIQGNSSMASTALPAGWQKQTPLFNNSTVSGCMWVYPNWTGGNVSAAITNAPGDCGWSIHEYSGVDTSDAIEDSDGSTGNATTWTLTALTVAQGGAIVVAAGQESSAFDMTITTSGFTIRTDQDSHVHLTADNTNMTAGSYSTSGNPGGGFDWVATGVALNPAPSFSLEQEGFRFRNDDGSETTATWAATQDTNVTSPLSTNLRLRALINGTGDPASSAYTLYSKKSTDGTYRKVPLSTEATTWAFGSLGALPVSNATSTIDIAYPSPISEGDLIIVAIASRLGSTSIDAEGFSSLSNNTANVATSEGTAGTEGADAGGVRVTVFYKIADGTETGNVTFANSGTASLSKTGRMLTFTKPWWATWDLASVNGKDASSGVTTYSAAMGSDPGIAIGDILLVATAVNTDTPTWSAQDVTGTGLASALTTEHFEILSTGGNDVKLVVTEHDVTAALTSGVPTFTATMSTTAPEGASVLTRIRATGTPPIVISPSSNITAGGEATTVQLTAPSGKSTSDFVTGRMWDNENGTDSIDITTDDYTEVEWSLLAQSPAVDTDIYQFRVYRNTNALDTYTVTPEWTIGTAGGSTNLVVADLTSSSTLDNVVLTQANTLVVADALSSSTLDNVALTQANTLVVADATSSSTLDNVALTQNYTLAVADLTSSSMLDGNLGLTQANTLVVQDALSSSTVDNLALTQANILVVNDALSSSTVDNVDLSMAITLTVADMTSSSTLDGNLSLTQANTLAVNDLLSSSTVENTILTQAHVLSVNDLTSSSTSENITLSAGDTLVVADLTSSSTLDNTVLTQATTLTVADSLSSSTLDSFALTQANTLTVADLTSSSTLDNTALIQQHVLTLSDLLSTSSLDTFALTQANVLEVQDLRSTSTLDHAAVTGGDIIRKYYKDSNGDIYWIISQTAGLVEKV